MTCGDLLRDGILESWYTVSTKSGKLQVCFNRISEEDKDTDQPIFSISGIDNTDEKIGILEDMFRYAVCNKMERVQFKNSGFMISVIVDILETPR